MLRTSDSTDRAATPATEERPPGRTPARLLAQRGLFFGPSALVPEDLYSVVERGTARRERTRVQLSPGARVSTNTYFGRFHATYWQRWTDVGEVEVSALATGTGRLRLMASDTNKVWRIVASVDVTQGESTAVRLVGPVDRFVDGGGMWLEIATETDELTVSDVRWTVAAPRAVPPTDIAITTHNRVDDCLNTLQALSHDPGAMECIRTVHVADQGSDPIESRERFGEIAAALGDRLKYVRQPNLGGAGGFARGMLHATEGAPEEHADVLLMDDDVHLEPEILVRLTAFAASTRHPMIVGGQMLNLLHPGHLHISAEFADPEVLLMGLKMPGALREAYLLGVDERGLPTNQERRVDTEYNGWWSCLIPAAVIREIGYPLPLFLQWDDIEYGYRARERGFPTVSLPGAGVWHADFGWKDGDEWQRYFTVRNGLIMAALHSGFSVRRITGRLAQLVSHQLVAMQYGMTATLLEAVEDFLNGPEVLWDGSAGALARVRDIRKAYPETVMHPMSEAGGEFHDRPVVRAANAPGSETLTFLKRVAYQLTGRSAFHTGAVPAGDAHWWHVSLFERAIVTDMSEQGFRVRTRDKQAALELGRRAALLLRRFVREAPAVAGRYRTDLGTLSSRENWNRLYGLDD
jgi:galactofuranosylgalactofuranosylrhamnosyl-N-acetylglucosaminyl-diphospho-decaprenol beta-1,5/1,6-galactofuranosyltransferase